MKVFIFLFFITTTLFAEEYKPTPIENVEMKCGKEISLDIEWSYCISKTKGSDNQNILYHFHGRNGNATWWNDKEYHTGKIHKEWIINKKSPPVVISISFGKVWFLLKTGEKSGLFDVFLNEVMYKVEEKLSFSPHGRSIIGISMGALNTFYLSMSNSSLFKKVAILCAHIPFITHEDGLIKVMKYSFEHKVSLKRTFMMYKMSQKFFPTKKIQQLNNPSGLLKKFNPELSPEFYITCGKKDDWGCMKSSEMVSNKIKMRNGKVNWVPRDGGHCDLDHKGIAKFLID
jgi:S-formylglutathione hydrolase FrmB